MKLEELGPIFANAIYPLSEFMRLTGLRTASIREMRRVGLIVRRIGRRSYIRGSDFLSWYEKQAEIVA